MKRAMLWVVMLGMLMGAGSVRTRDGRTIEGLVELDDGGVVVRASPDAAPTRLALADISRALLRTEVFDRPVGGPNGALPAGWNSQDIGPVHRKGSATCDEKGVFTIKASGWGAWGPEDTMHYVYRPLEGDGQIMARLAEVDESHGRMAATVMFRQDLSPDAPMAGATIHPGGEVRLSRRLLHGAPAFLRADEIAPRAWIRLTRRGDIFSVYRSANGRFWELVDSRKIEMSASALVGLGAWTVANTSLGTVRMDSVVVVPGTPAANWFPGGDGLLQGIVLRDGTAKAGIIQSADDTGFRLLHKGQMERIPRHVAARLVFNPVPPDLAIGTKKGLWMNNGDFVEGELTEVAMRPVRPESRDNRLYVVVNSVLFGTRRFEALREVMVAVLADVTPAGTPWRVRTADGSVYRPGSIEIRRSGVVADGVELTDVVEIARE